MERELNSKQILAEMELRLSEPTIPQPFNPGSIHEIETIPVDLTAAFTSNSDGTDSDGRPTVDSVDGGGQGRDSQEKITRRNSKGKFKEEIQTTQLSDIDENLSESSNSVQL